MSRIARRDRERFFEGRPEYRDRLLCVALCQGGGLHYVDQVSGAKRLNGVKDFDVWTFFADIPGQRFPADRRNTHDDFGPSRFGKWDREGPRFQAYEGRRVDLLMRALPCVSGCEPDGSRPCVVGGRPDESARLLATKGVVLIKPNKYRARVIWPLRLDLVE